MFTVRPDRPLHSQEPDQDVGAAEAAIALGGSSRLPPLLQGTVDTDGQESVRRPTERMAGAQREPVGAALAAITATCTKYRGEYPAGPEGAVQAVPERPIRPTPGTSISMMATPTPTIRPIPTTFVSCVAEREPAGKGVVGAGMTAKKPAAIAASAAPTKCETDPFDFAALWRAYRACRKGKRNTRETQRYEARLLDRLVSTRNALASFDWRPSRTLAFVVSQPKLREIHAATFADRVVHHLLVARLNRLYEPVFIHDSYANRLGKGTHAAVDRLQAFMRSATQSGQRPVYALQLDIANFFNSIHRPTLFRLLQRRLVRAVRRREGALGAAAAAKRQAVIGRLNFAASAAPTRGGEVVGAGMTAKTPGAIAAAATPTKAYPGLGPCLEFRAEDMPGVRKHLKRAGQAHALAAQTGHLKSGFKRREVVLIWRPSTHSHFLSSSNRGTS